MSTHIARQPCRSLANGGVHALKRLSNLSKVLITYAHHRRYLRLLYAAAISVSNKKLRKNFE